MNRTEKQSATKAHETRSSGSGRRDFIVDLWGVRYQVEDVSRSVAFYTEQLGFKLDHQKLPAFAQVSIGNLKLILSGPGASGSRPMPDGRARNRVGGTAWCFRWRTSPRESRCSRRQGFVFETRWRRGPEGDKSRSKTLTEIRSNSSSLLDNSRSGIGHKPVLRKPRRANVDFGGRGRLKSGGSQCGSNLNRQEI